MHLLSARAQDLGLRVQGFGMPGISRSPFCWHREVEDCDTMTSSNKTSNVGALIVRIGFWGFLVIIVLV